MSPSLFGLLLISRLTLSCILGAGSSVSFVKNGAVTKQGYHTSTASDVLEELSADDMRAKDPLKDTWQCVDARGDDPALGTPGGDFSEFALGLTSYFKQKGITRPSENDIQPIFRSFLNKVASESRPFYFHTDFLRLQDVYPQLAQYAKTRFGIDYRPFRIPAELPMQTVHDMNIVEAWLHFLTLAETQGCGHVRLGIQNSTLYGWPDATLVTNLIRVLYKTFWSLSYMDPMKSKFKIAVKLGALEGRAIVIVNTNDTQCPGYQAALTPNSRGGSVFLYHAAGITSFRQNVLGPFFKDYDSSIDLSQLNTDVADLAAKQLTATLTYLDPANAVPLYQLNVPLVRSSTSAPTPTTAPFSSNININFAGLFSGMNFRT